MNRSNVATLYRSAKERAHSVAGKAAIACTALVPGFAFASGGGSGFDSSTIISKINENSGTAVMIIGAMVLAVWGLRSMGLLKGRG